VGRVLMLQRGKADGEPCFGRVGNIAPRLRDLTVRDTRGSRIYWGRQNARYEAPKQRLCGRSD
jgi:hypothetical protein